MTPSSMANGSEQGTRNTPPSKSQLTFPSLAGFFRQKAVPGSGGMEAFGPASVFSSHIRCKSPLTVAETRAITSHTLLWKLPELQLLLLSWCKKSRACRRAFAIFKSDIHEITGPIDLDTNTTSLRYTQASIPNGSLTVSTI